MDSNTIDSEKAGDDEVELRQLLMELQQLTKQQTSYTTVLQSLSEKQSVVNDRLLQMAATVDIAQTWNKLKNMNLLEKENQSLRNKVDELTKAEQLLDANLKTLKSKLSESAFNSKKLLQANQQLLKDIDDLKAKLDSSKLEQEQQRVKLNRLEASVEEITTEKRRLLQRVNQLTAEAEKVSVLQRKTFDLKEKLASMERVQALRSLRELEDTCVNEDIRRVQALRSLRELEDTCVNEDTRQMCLELIEETAKNHGTGEKKDSGW